MHKYLYIIITVFSFLQFSCKSSNTFSEKLINLDCNKKNIINNPNQIYKSIKKYSFNDSIKEISEIRFCTKSSLSTIKAIYNEYGIWNSYIKNTKTIFPFLLWKNIKFFEEDNELYNLIVFESYSDDKLQGAITILDRNGNDILLKKPQLKEKIILKYIELINKTYRVESNFYEFYLKTIDKNHYNEVAQIRINQL